MEVLLIAIAAVLVVSAVCSLAEAALYAVNISYVRTLHESGSRAGRILHRFKGNMERPISAILILNTLANTAGATVAGAQAVEVFGVGSLVWFSIGMTVSVLLIGEIVPKVLGVTHSRVVSLALAIPLDVAVRTMSPLITVTSYLSRAISRGTVTAPTAPREEVLQLARISAEEGSILPEEERLVNNVLLLASVRAEDIMTPRTVVLKVNADDTVGELAALAPNWPNSRLIVEETSNGSEDWVGIVLKTKVLTKALTGDTSVKIRKLMSPLPVVPETATASTLLQRFVTSRSHLFGVVDEYGSIVGIVTLEDVVESLIGAEIVDETDAAVDMQELARRRARLVQIAQRAAQDRAKRQHEQQEQRDRKKT